MSEVFERKEKLKLNFVKYRLLELYKIDIIQELLYAGIGSFSLFVLYFFFPRFFWDSPYREIICGIIVLSFFLVFIILNQPNSKIAFFKVDYKRNIILFTIFNLAILNFLFFHTDFGCNGLHQDNFYRSAYITQMAYSGRPMDMTFKGFSAFMAPLYWYLLALFAIAFQIEPYKMLKIGFLISYYILPILLYEFWKKICNNKSSFLITAIFFTFIANYFEIMWIDHLISYMFFVPFFIYYFENYTNKEFTKKDYIIAGIIGSVLVCTFYLYFILVPIYLLISLIQDIFQDNLEMYKKKFKVVEVRRHNVLLGWR